MTTAERLPRYPQLPTVAESLPGYELLGWYGFVAPTGTPAPVVATLNKAFNDALADPAVKEKLSGMGFEIAGGPPQRLADMIRSESVKWKKVVDDIGLKLD